MATSVPPVITANNKDHSINVNTRRVTLSRLFKAANDAALEEDTYHREWKIKLCGTTIGSIRLASKK